MKLKACLMVAVATMALPLAALPAKAGNAPFVGEIMMVGYNFCPRGWANADGQLLPISQNTALFSLYGTTYGGDGRTTFGLPDLRGRVPVHLGHGPGLTDRRLGERSGQENITLNVNQLPSHNHQLIATDAERNTHDPKDALLAALPPSSNIYSTRGKANVQMNNGSVSLAGKGQSVNTMPPFLTIRFCVSLQGTFPSRN